MRVGDRGEHPGGRRKHLEPALFTPAIGHVWWGGKHVRMGPQPIAGDASHPTAALDRHWVNRPKLRQD
jgi:hypothetical protein